ncbi:Inositol-pentakisphosphate 2-kinase [Blyttiomyces sp. JEL0837]|nr:Inositol-pentakisphosphate 2-kinase [Blyttiomyces sp. JEL0837]
MEYKGEGNRHIVVSVVVIRNKDGSIDYVRRKEELDTSRGANTIRGVVRLRKRSLSDKKVEEKPEDQEDLQDRPPLPMQDRFRQFLSWICLAYNDPRVITGAISFSRFGARQIDLERTHATHATPVATLAAFYNAIMSKLIGIEYLGSMIPVKVSRTFVNDLKRFVENARPSERRQASEVDPDQDMVILSEDHTVFLENGASSVSNANVTRTNATVSFELKPKWGFLPSALYLSGDSLIKSRVCRYCMHEMYKLHEGKVQQTSGFCPLDLFSGVEERMMHGLRSLFQCPQNNLKAFLNGNKIDLRLDSDLNSLTNELNLTSEQILALLTRILRQEPLLYNLRQHQMKLDPFGVEIIHSIYQDYLTRMNQPTTSNTNTTSTSTTPSSNTAYPSLIPQPTPVQWERILQDYLDRNGQTQALDTLTESQKLQSIYEFTISTALKDCSLIITLRKKSSSYVRHSNSGFFPPPITRVLDACGYLWEYKIHVVDVDIKPVTKIVSYLDKDKRIVHKKKDSDKGGNKKKKGGSTVTSNDEDVEVEPFNIKPVTDSMTAAVDPVLDTISITHKGSRVSLSQIAQISAKDAQTLLVVLNDEEFLPIAEKAIKDSNLGLNPQREDRSVLKVPIPKLSKDYKDVVLKSISQTAEKARTQIRDVRGNARNDLKKRKGPVSANELRNNENQIQKETDKFIKEVEALVDAKKSEVANA